MIWIMLLFPIFTLRARSRRCADRHRFQRASHRGWLTERLPCLAHTPGFVSLLQSVSSLSAAPQLAKRPQTSRGSRATSRSHCALRASSYWWYASSPPSPSRPDGGLCYSPATDWIQILCQFIVTGEGVYATSTKLEMRAMLRPCRRGAWPAEVQGLGSPHYHGDNVTVIMSHGYDNPRP